MLLMILKKSIKVRSEKRVEATVRLNSSLMSEVRLTVKLKMMMMRLFNFKGKPPHDNKFGFLFVLSLAKHYHRAEKSQVSLFFTSLSTSLSIYPPISSSTSFSNTTSITNSSFQTLSSRNLSLFLFRV